MTSARAIMCTRFLSSAYRVVDRRNAGEPVGEQLLTVAASALDFNLS